MAKNANSNANDTLTELLNRVEWLDEERRKSARKFAEMEQRLELQAREIEGREQRIQQLEEQVATLTSRVMQLPQIDVQLDQFKDDLSNMIEKYDERRIQSEGELDRRRRVEHELLTREISDLRNEMPEITRLQDEMELRKAEEARLANLIGLQQNRVATLTNLVDNSEQTVNFLQEKEKQNGRYISEVQTSISEINKRLLSFNERVDGLNSIALRTENKIQTITESQTEVKDSTKSWMEQIQLGEYERNRRLEKWRETMAEIESTITGFKNEWIKMSDQYKEAEMAVQTLADWQEQIEKQQQEASEMVRVESHRMQSRWDNFLLENEKKHRDLLVDLDQRWATTNRHERELREQLTLLEETLHKIEEDRDTMWRVQTAQADAIKKFSLVWLEEVEKAASQNPNRRRQPALVPVREE